MEKQARKHADVLPSSGGSTPPASSGGHNCSKAKKNPLKKKEKDSTEMMSKHPRTEMSSDHEMFMQAFEKPTQIYRFLRTRNELQPIFLHRNLYYMRNRMSRSHKSRQSFKIDSMLAQKMAKIRSDKSNLLAMSDGYLTLLFLGFFDEKNQSIRNGADSNGIVMPMKNAFVDEALGVDDDDDRRELEYGRKCVQVETNLLKIAHAKRKDMTISQMQLTVGKSQVLVNPKDGQFTSPGVDTKPAVVSIPTNSFNIIGAANHMSSTQCSFVLRFRVFYTNGGTGRYLANGSVSDGEEPSSKRLKLNGHSKLYSTELAIFDKGGQCLLKEADYELTVREIMSHQKSVVAKYGSPMKNRFWATMPDALDMLDFLPDECGKTDVPPTSEDFIERYEEMIKPTLKIRLQWTKEPPRGFDASSPLGGVGNDADADMSGHGYNDKENHKPPSFTADSFKKGLNININNNRIMTPAAATGPLNDVESSSSPNSAVPAADGDDSLLDVKPEPFPDDNKSLVLASDAGGGSPEKVLQRVIYHFIHNNYSRQQTENEALYTCPWCCLKCGALYPLLKHLRLCHARFNFNYVPIPNGARIDVTINELYDGSYNGSPHDLLGPSMAYSLRGPLRRTVVTNLLVCRPRRQKPSLTEFVDNDETEFDSQRPYITGHSRMYHHTMTCLPVYPRELDIDSEGESDPLWLQHKTMQMIDEFTDVNEGEKELMKMWNLHVMKYGYVGDCQIPVALEMFIDHRGRELMARNLYRNFVLHMCSMFDFGLVSADVMQRIIRKMRKIPVNETELQQTMKQARTEQMSYWNNVTVHKQKAEPRNGGGERTAGAGACTSTSGGPYHLHKAGLGAGGSGSSNTGDGQQRKVKPTITPAKNTDPAAISPPRRRSATAKGGTLTTTATGGGFAPQSSSIKARVSSHSTATAPKPGTSGKASSSSAGASKKSSTASGVAATPSSSSSSSSHAGPNKHPISHLKATFSPIMTRRKSLSLGSHLSLLQRKRSLN